jgi:hypothetical protein
MKKLLAILLVAALAFTLVACGEDTDTGSGGSGATVTTGGGQTAPTAPTPPTDATVPTEGTSPNPPNIDGSMSDTKFLAVLNALEESGTVAMEMSADEQGVNVEMKVYGKDEDFYMFMDMGMEGMSLMQIQMLLVDGSLYFFNEEDKTYNVIELDADQTEEILGGFGIEDLANFGDLEAMKFLGDGNEEFDGKELFFEEFEMDSMGMKVNSKIFFDGNNIIGMSVAGQEIAMSISSDVPANAFAVPTGYTKSDEEMSFEEMIAGLGFLLG